MHACATACKLEYSTEKEFLWSRGLTGPWVGFIRIDYIYGAFKVDTERCCLRIHQRTLHLIKTPVEKLTFPLKASDVNSLVEGS
jgi:hypothetical protein